MAKNAVKTVAKPAARKATKSVAKTAAKSVAKTPAKSVAKTAAKVVAKHEPKSAAKSTAKKDGKKKAESAAKSTHGNAAKHGPKEAARHEEKETAKKVLHDNDTGESDPIDEGLRLIQSKPEGILQSELWKELGVDSRKCSRIVKKLEESGLIERVDFKREGIKTYLLRARQQPVNPSHLLAGDELIPCIGCELECVVEECHPLMDWMYQLAIVQHTEE